MFRLRTTTCWRTLGDRSGRRAFRCPPAPTPSPSHLSGEALARYTSKLIKTCRSSLSPVYYYDQSAGSSTDPNVAVKILFFHHIWPLMTFSCYAGGLANLLGLFFFKYMFIVFQDEKETQDKQIIEKRPLPPPQN